MDLSFRVSNTDRETTPFKSGFEIENAEHFHSILGDCVLVPHDRDMPECERFKQGLHDHVMSKRVMCWRAFGSGN